MVLWFTGRSLVLAGKKYTNTIYITPVGLTTTDRIYENSLVSVNQPIAATTKTIPASCRSPTSSECILLRVTLHPEHVQSFVYNFVSQKSAPGFRVVARPWYVLGAAFSCCQVSITYITSWWLASRVDIVLYFTYLHLIRRLTLLDSTTTRFSLCYHLMLLSVKIVNHW